MICDSDPSPHPPAGGSGSKLSHRRYENPFHREKAGQGSRPAQVDWKGRPFKAESATRGTELELVWIAGGFLYETVFRPILLA